MSAQMGGEGMGVARVDVFKSVDANQWPKSFCMLCISVLVMRWKQCVGERKWMESTYVLGRWRMWVKCMAILPMFALPSVMGSENVGAGQKHSVKCFL